MYGFSMQPNEMVDSANKINSNLKRIKNALKLDPETQKKYKPQFDSITESTLMELGNFATALSNSGFIFWGCKGGEPNEIAELDKDLANKYCETLTSHPVTSGNIQPLFQVFKDYHDKKVELSAKLNGFESSAYSLMYPQLWDIWGINS